MSVLNEEVFFFPGSEGHNLFGFLHQPNPENARQRGIVYCHPFAEEKNMSHAVVVKTARRMAERGYAVLRFDLSGCGDSEGELSQASLKNWQRDLDAAIDILFQKADVSSYVLWGLRLGGGLALLQGKQHQGAAGFLLWQPVIDFSLHMQQFLRRAISSEISSTKREPQARLAVEKVIEGQGEINVTGYTVSRELYREFLDTGRLSAKFTAALPALVVSISPTEEALLSQQNCVQQIQKRGLNVQLSHVQVQTFWDRYWQWDCKEVWNCTVDWLYEL